MWDFLIRLGVAFACGAAIGLERQLRQRRAGLRTITLVSSGSCLFVTLGVLTGPNAGITQIAAYVVSGVGFLGGGVIMRDKGSIQGINTAATLWCAAATGVLSGTGHFMPAIAGAGVVLLNNTALRALSRAINASPLSTADLVRRYVLTVVCEADDELHIRAILSNLMTSSPLTFQGLSSSDLPVATSSTSVPPPASQTSPRIEVIATLEAHPKHQGRLEYVASRLSMEKGVSSVSWQGLPAEPTPE